MSRETPIGDGNINVMATNRVPQQHRSEGAAIRILQINANRSVVVHDAATISAYDHKCDLIAISEPNKKKCDTNSKYFAIDNKDVLVINNSSQTVIKFYKSICYVALQLCNLLVVCV